MRIDSWSAHQLTEFLALVGSSADERAALRSAVERAAEAFEAEVGAIVVGDALASSIGFPAGRAPAAQLVETAHHPGTGVEVEGLGAGFSTSVVIDGLPEGRLVLVRLAEPFTAEETNVLRGMARVLGLTLLTIRGIAEERRQADENARLLATLRESQELIEELGRVQRSISAHSRIEDTFQAIVDGASVVLRSEVVGLRLRDDNDPSYVTLVASCGVTPDVERAHRRSTLAETIGGHAVAEGRLVIANIPTAFPEGTTDHFNGLRAAMAAPVLEHGTVVGSLVVATSEARKYTSAEGELLVRFAEHAGIALSAARAADAAWQTFHDPLTGLANRALFLDRVEQALARNARADGDLAVLFVDLDGFKLVNDSLGHLAGDRLLNLVAERLRGCVRFADTAARLGGDEFALLLVDPRDAGRPEWVASAVHEALVWPFEVGGREVHITASIGIAAGRPGVEAEELVRDADIAMYQAKSRGPSRHVRFERQMYAKVVEEMERRAALQGALDRNEIDVHFQPIVELATRRVIGFEALARWQHPERGLMLPAEFIPLAETTGLIRPIGLHVLDEACRRLAQWLGHGHDLALSVNLSTHQLEDGLADSVGEVLRTHRISPERLTLEITESQLMHDVESARRHLGALRDLGVKLAIDDFGTGYSSLRYLRNFPVHTLKIAKSFIDGLAEPSEEARALVQAIVGLAGNLGLTTVAEGIEHRSQLEPLEALGCVQGQGYLFARPLEATAAEALIATSTLASVAA